MSGVDMFDQHLSFYSFNRKTVKWGKRCATHFLHMAKVQAMILYNKFEDKEVSQGDSFFLIFFLVCKGFSFYFVLCLFMYSWQKKCSYVMFNLQAEAV